MTVVQEIQDGWKFFALKSTTVQWLATTTTIKFACRCCSMLVVVSVYLFCVQTYGSITRTKASQTR